MEGPMDDSEHGIHLVRWLIVGSLNWHMVSHQLFLIDGSKPIQEEPTMKLLEVAQAHYQKFIKLMRRKKKNND
ncbi:hypothetical protein GOBAR_DD02561 [Gossypium barbadense]|nr:hypothetical protein GOBAR_DD02561 [Gossypium barbadense]